jgi:guanine deaminase
MPLTEVEMGFLEQAVELSAANVGQGRGGPFGALVVREGIIIGKGANSVNATNDPTAHAEMVAIREACSNIGDFQLTGPVQIG